MESGKIKKVGLFYLSTKRFFDILLSFLGIVFLSWLFLIIAIIVVVTSGIPILYKDKRVGKNNRIFYCLKFRTMYVDANERLEKYLTKEELEKWNKERKIDNDPRITPFGKILRKISLDELPQLFNIFVGQMSIIGPRPITEKELHDNFSNDEQEMLLSVRPGLFSNWSINGRNNVTFKSGLRQKYELEYFEHRSVWYETKMFFKVFYVVISTKGAK